MCSVHCLNNCSVIHILFPFNWNFLTKALLSLYWTLMVCHYTKPSDVFLWSEPWPFALIAIMNFPVSYRVGQRLWFTCMGRLHTKGFLHGKPHWVCKAECQRRNKICVSYVTELKWFWNGTEVQWFVQNGRCLQISWLMPSCLSFQID